MKLCGVMVVSILSDFLNHDCGQIASSGEKGMTGCPEQNPTKLRDALLEPAL